MFFFLLLLLTLLIRIIEMQKKKKIFELKSGIGERLGDIKNNGETIGILFFPPLAQ